MGCLFIIGMIYHQQDRLEEAKQAFPISAKYHPYDARPLRVLGETQKLLGKSDAAKESFAKASKLEEPLEPRSFQDLLVYYWLDQMFERTLE